MPKVFVYCRVATKEHLSFEKQETTPRFLMKMKKAECPQRILRSCKDTPHGPSDRVRTCGLMVPNGSYDSFSRSSPLVFRPAVRCNAVVARCAEFLSGTVWKFVLQSLLSDCGCDCGSAFWVLLNVLRDIGNWQG